MALRNAEMKKLVESIYFFLLEMFTRLYKSSWDEVTWLAALNHRGEDSCKRHALHVTLQATPLEGQTF